MTTENKELFRSLKNYSLGFLIVRFGQFFLIPLYWKYLTIDEIGIIGLSQLIGNFITPILGMGQSEFIQREISHNSDENKVISLSWHIISMTSLAIFLIGPLVFFLIPELKFKNISIQYIIASAISYIFMNYTIITLSFLRIKNKIKTYNTITTLTFTAQFLSTFYFIAILDMKIEGYFTSTVLSSFIIFIGHHALIWKKINFRVSYSEVKENLNYSFPIMTSGILDGASTLFDRYFIDRFLPSVQLGLYTSTQQVGMLYNSVNQIFKTAWFPFLFQLYAKKNDIQKIKTIENISLVALYVLLFTSLILSILTPFIIHIFNVKKFFSIIPYIPLIFAGLYLLSIGTIMGRGMDLTKTNALQPLIPLSALTVNFALSFFLVSRLGLIGAYIAFICTYFIKSLVQIVLNYRVFKRNIYPLDIFICSLASIITAITSFIIYSEKYITTIFIYQALLLIMFSLIVYIFRINNKIQIRIF